MHRFWFLASFLLSGLIAAASPATAEPRSAAVPPARVAGDPSETSALPDDPVAQAQRLQLQKQKGCAVEWTARKRAGKTGGQSWREFAAACMKP
ncbi:hypothetical protein [Alsobacter sp. R-9]